MTPSFTRTNKHRSSKKKGILRERCILWRSVTRVHNGSSHRIVSLAQGHCAEVLGGAGMSYTAGHRRDPHLQAQQALLSHFRYFPTALTPWISHEHKTRRFWFFWFLFLHTKIRGGCTRPAERRLSVNDSSLQNKEINRIET